MKPFLSLKDIHKKYEQGSHSISILKGVNLSIEAGEKIAILGPSGSGKSTLISLIAGLHKPTKGLVMIDNQSINDMGEYKLARFRGDNIGIVFQQFHLMKHLTALENVSLPLEIMGIKDYKTQAQESLDRMGLKDRYDHLPHELSGGECQRVAIARAFITKPKLLLADEPSGNLDRKTGDNVMNSLLSQVSEKGTTLILVTHNTDLASHCDRQLTLTDGLLK